MKVSGFTFIHDGITGGYPFVEAIGAVRPYVDEMVAVDIESTDDTRRILTALCDKVLDSKWEGTDTTPNAFLKHTECSGDVIIFFEADEVYDDSLLKGVQWYFARGDYNLAVWRLQLEQNFQRCREYPIPTHRIFPKGLGTYHLHPTIYPSGLNIKSVSQSEGYLWDCSNCFKENWVMRKRNQSQIWGPSRHLRVPNHFTEPVEISVEDEMANLNNEHWLWTTTPFRIPEILKPLVGQTKYQPKIGYNVYL